jgi:hypothetical protein
MEGMLAGEGAGAASKLTMLPRCSPVRRLVEDGRPYCLVEVEGGGLAVLHRS